jgi:hypothetical protein
MSSIKSRAVSVECTLSTVAYHENHTISEFVVNPTELGEWRVDHRSNGLPRNTIHLFVDNVRFCKHLNV